MSPKYPRGKKNISITVAFNQLRTFFCFSPLYHVCLEYGMLDYIYGVIMCGGFFYCVFNV